MLYTANVHLLTDYCASTERQKGYAQNVIITVSPTSPYFIVDSNVRERVAVWPAVEQKYTYAKVPDGKTVETEPIYVLL